METTTSYVRRDKARTSQTGEISESQSSCRIHKSTSVSSFKRRSGGGGGVPTATLLPSGTKSSRDRDAHRAVSSKPSTRSRPLHSVFSATTGAKFVCTSYDRTDKGAQNVILSPLNYQLSYDFLLRYATYHYQNTQALFQSKVRGQAQLLLC